MSSESEKRSGACLALGTVLLLATAAGAQETPDDDAIAETVTLLDPEEWGIGEQVADLPFVDLDGEHGRLSDYADRPALVLVIRDVGCPVSQRIGVRTAEWEAHFLEHDVSFLYVNLSPQDDVESCRGEAELYGFQGRYARDHDELFGSHLQVRTTTEIFVLDQYRRLRYRGAIDDQIGRGVTQPKIGSHLLADAVERILAGRRIREPANAAPGCVLDFPPIPKAFDEPAEVTWYGRVERIVQEKCQNCHRPLGGGPFDLLAPTDMAGRRAMVQKVVSERSMPPWYATDESGPFANDYRLAPEDRLDLLRWIQNGCPEGDPAEGPPPLEFENGWTVGEPDLIVPMPKPVTIPESGVVDYLYYRTDVILEEDRWVTASQILPTVPEVVHHVIVFQQLPSGRWQFFDSYLPGKPPTFHEPGSAMLLKGGTRLRFGMHYTPIGREVVDQTEIGFVFADEPPEWHVRGKIVPIGRRFTVPAGAEDFRLVSEMVLPIDAKLRKLMPHMHLRGRSSIIDVIFPDGATQRVLEIPRFDPNWQLYYELLTPLELPKGTKIQITSVWDNSANNPFNPDPTVDVHRGSQIWDEMGGSYVEWAYKQGSLKNFGGTEQELFSTEDDEIADRRARRERRRRERDAQRAEEMREKGEGGGGGAATGEGGSGGESESSGSGNH